MLRIAMTLFNLILFKFFYLQYSSEEEEENLGDTMARLAKKKKVRLMMSWIYGTFYKKLCRCSCGCRSSGLIVSIKQRFLDRL